MAKNHRATPRNRKNTPGMIQNLRQSLVDPSIRINERNSPYEEGELERAVNLWLETQEKKSGQKEQAPGDDQSQELLELRKSLKEAREQQLKNMVMVCNGIWRVQQNINLSVKEQSTSRLLRTKRHIDTLVDQISAAGFTYKDHTGEPYDTGTQLMVLSTEPAEGLTTEKVIETVKPSIYFNGDLIQTGEVIIGTPMEVENPQKDN